MERIKKALDKAREQRAARGEAVVPAPAPQAEGSIRYTETRSIKIADATLKRNRVITGSDGEDEYSNAYKILRTRILKQLQDNNWNTLAITSPGEDAGKTQTAVNLALSIAMEVTKTVLLVDADLRRPTIHALFDLEPGRGLSDYLRTDVPLQEILINPGIERLVILPGGEPLANSSELLAAPRMEQLVNDIKHRYPSRIVLFDLPPVLAVDDVLAFSPYVDAALLVVEEGKTTREELARALELLQDGVQSVWTVLNKSRDPAQSYYY